MNQKTFELETTFTGMDPRDSNVHQSLLHQRSLLLDGGHGHPMQDKKRCGEEFTTIFGMDPIHQPSTLGGRINTPGRGHVFKPE